MSDKISNLDMKLINSLIIIASFLLLQCFFLSECVMASDMSEKEISYMNEELDELEESNITTKIYKSSDPFFDLLEKEANIDPTIGDDVLTKEELLIMNKEHEYKLLNNYENKNRKAPRSIRSILFPWFVAFVLIGCLGLVFKFLVRKNVM